MTESEEQAVELYACPVCYAAPGVMCIHITSKEKIYLKHPHAERMSDELPNMRAVPVRLYERQYDALAHMDVPMSQWVREVVEQALIDQVPGYASQYYKYTGTGFPELAEIDLYGDKS